MESDNRVEMVVKNWLIKTQSFRADVPLLGPPEGGGISVSSAIIPRSLKPKKHTYIGRIIEQANGSYESGYYDACNVMLRRLLETLIIEVFESAGQSELIKDSEGNFFMLGQLVDALLKGKWNLSRSAKQVLPRLKAVGDKSAHSRYFVAQRQDVEKNAPAIRDVVQELLFVSGLI